MVRGGGGQKAFKISVTRGRLPSRVTFHRRSSSVRSSRGKGILGGDDCPPPPPLSNIPSKILQVWQRRRNAENLSFKGQKSFILSGPRCKVPRPLGALLLD